MTKLLVRIPIFETVASDKLRVVGRKELEPVLFSVEGGPMTDNVVFVSDQRVFVLKRTAVLRSEVPYKSITG